MVQSNANDLNASNAAFTYRDMPVGTKVKMTEREPWNGAVGQVTGNPGDGAWLLIKWVEYPGQEGKVGSDDMVFFMDVDAIL
jgi:hypothetical protein